MLLRVILLYLSIPNALAYRLIFNFHLWCSYMPEGGFRGDFMIHIDGDGTSKPLLKKWIRFGHQSPVDYFHIYTRVSRSGPPDLFMSLLWTWLEINHNCGWKKQEKENTKLMIEPCKVSWKPCFYYDNIVLDWTNRTGPFIGGRT